MARPGIAITSRAATPARSAPTNVGMAFIVGPTNAGDTTPKLVRSLADYEAGFGARAGATEMYDAVDAFFREGGTAAYIARANTGATTDVPAALDFFTADLGPGQVFAPSSQAAATHGALLAHAKANNRVALLDALAADDTATELGTTAAALRSDVNSRYGALFAPHVTIPGIAGGTARTVPPSAIVAGIISRNDQANNPNVAAAGSMGASTFATDVAVRFSDADRDTLNTAGVNVVRAVFDGVRNYGFRTLAAADSGWSMLTNARLNMAITAKAQEVAERYVFAQLDGRRVKISQFGAELTALCVPYYEMGALYGDTPDDAFFVDVGPTVNTDATIAAGELRALIALRMSPFAELVSIEIVKTAVDTPLAVAA